MIFTLSRFEGRTEGRLTGVVSAANGWVEVMIWPALPAAAQSDFDGQEMPNMPFGSPPFGGMTLVNDHSAAPPVGSVETMTSALLSTAAQAEGEGQETAETCVDMSAPIVFQASRVPRSG